MATLVCLVDAVVVENQPGDPCAAWMTHSALRSLISNGIDGHGRERPIMGSVRDAERVLELTRQPGAVRLGALPAITVEVSRAAACWIPRMTDHEKHGLLRGSWRR